MTDQEKIKDLRDRGVDTNNELSDEFLLNEAHQLGEYEEEEEKWICTDPDMNQYGRKTGDKMYEFKQDMTYPDGSIVKEEKDIDLNDYSDDEINNHLSAYGWTIKQLKEENDLDGAEWLMAECIFEQTAF